MSASWRTYFSTFRASWRNDDILDTWLFFDNHKLLLAILEKMTFLNLQPSKLFWQKMIENAITKGEESIFFKILISFDATLMDLLCNAIYDLDIEVAKKFFGWIHRGAYNNTKRENKGPCVPNI